MHIQKAFNFVFVIVFLWWWIMRLEKKLRISSLLSEDDLWKTL